MDSSIPEGSQPVNQRTVDNDNATYLEVVKQGGIHMTESNPSLLRRCEGLNKIGCPRRAPTIRTFFVRKRPVVHAAEQRPERVLVQLHDQFSKGRYHMGLALVETHGLICTILHDLYYEKY